MDRRDALAALLAASAALAAPAWAQPRLRRVVFLAGSPERTVAGWMAGFRDGMAALGYQDGRNLTLEYRYGGASRELDQQLAAETVASKPDLIVGQAGMTHAVAAFTKTIPTVAIYSGDMVDGGLAKSLASPGGNVTGLQLMALDLVGKRIEILKEMAPTIRRLAVLASPNHPGVHREQEAAVNAARKLGLSVAYYPVKNAAELEAGLLAALAAGTDALVLFPNGVTNIGRQRIAAFALQHRLPTVSGWDIYALAGGLLTYGPNMTAAFRYLAGYVDKVLKGADPATLPVELPTTFELVVNQKTARALGLKVPASVLLRADRVIDA